MSELYAEWTTANGMRVKVLSATPDAERVVWQCAHQDYASGFAADDPVPTTYGSSIVKNLLQRGHFGPFEHPQIVMNIGGVSRALMAQLTRHRVGISFDVQSLRYTKVEEAQPSDFVLPPYLQAGRTRERFKGTVEISEPDAVEELFHESYARALESYKKLLAAGVPAEDARMVLPIGLKINLTMSCDARTMMHLLDMRLPANAQWEIRELCESLLDISKVWMPNTFAWYEANRARKHKLAP